ncbi:hypothetical protein PV04_00475 [Phialophora macrospora]|uniref:Uncharacterized protein n=1 Tax=Phialophora macrospora TaxID=1851006 RepID=A0A0D2GIT6_9EURO|nr:hypothetical protein PV04_00475 [Phialophora macrospora]
MKGLLATISITMALSASVLAAPVDGPFMARSLEVRTAETGEGPAGICFGGCGPGVIKREPEPVPEPKAETGEGPAGICFGGCGPGVIKRAPEESPVATIYSLPNPTPIATIYSVVAPLPTHVHLPRDPSPVTIWEQPTPTPVATVYSIEPVKPIATAA